MYKVFKIFVFLVFVMFVILNSTYDLSSETKENIKIVFPVDKTYINGEYINLVFLVNFSEIDTVSYMVNKRISPLIEVKSSSTKKVKNGVVYICNEIILDEGENNISVFGYFKGEFIEQKNIKIFWVSKSSRDKNTPPSNYVKNSFHVAANEKLCSECHVTLNQPVKITGNLEESPCYVCHKMKVSEKFVHGPAAVGDCLSCHEILKNGKYLIAEPFKNLCFTCHFEKKKVWESKKYTHGPTATGNCTICHSPHSSKVKFFLKKEVNNLCISCHEEKGTGRHIIAGYVFGDSHPVSGVKSPVKPDNGFSCTSCHSPHTSNSKEMFIFELKGGKLEICQVCHKK